AFLPLLGTLGYESALLFSLLAAWVGALLPLQALRLFRRMDARRGETAGSGAHHRAIVNGNAEGRRSVWVLAGRWLHLTLAGWTLLVLPMAVLTLNALRVPNCAPLEGALFWLLLPFPTVAFAAAALLFLDALLGRRAGAAYVLLLLLLFLQPFVQIYTRPQIFAYNHVFGMFLGLSWDQSQPPFLTLLLYRLSTLSYVALLLTAATTLRLRRRGGFAAGAGAAGAGAAGAGAAEAGASGAGAAGAGAAIMGGPRTVLLVAFLLPLAAVLFFHLQSDRLGFTSSYAFVRSELGGEFRRENLRIVYDPATLDSAAVRRVAEEHLFQLGQVCAELGVEWTDEITSYLYSDAATKRRLLGTESSDLARPWRGEVHMALDSWAETVRHELTHVVAGLFGPYPNRAPFVRVLGLTEGLAMAVEWSWGNRTLHEFSAGMLAQGLLPHARDCMGTAGFVSGNSSRGYVASGSLTRWLMDSLGMAPIRNAYAADDLEGTLGVSYDELDRRWRLFLSAVPRRLPDSLAIAYAFRRPSLFSAVCPRVITERNRAAASAMRGGRPSRALSLYREAEALAPNARSAFGIVGALLEQREWDSVIAVTGRYLADSTRAFSLYPMQLWKAAALLRRDGNVEADSARADHALTRLIEEDLPGWTVPFAVRLRDGLRGGYRASLLPMLTDQLRRPVPGDDSLRLVRLRAMLLAFPEDHVIVGEYMRAEMAMAAVVDTGVGRNGEGSVDGKRSLSDNESHRTEARRRALAAFEHIEDLPLPYALRMFAVRLYALERAWDAALRLLRHQLNEQLTPAQRFEVTQWMARCAWGDQR
ncbi:MAG: hypothetical protein KFF77_09415, partial [Bacteroidetes bacterium]|nr:hypothetical protein [Bacteroidota bacterium]